MKFLNATGRWVFIGHSDARGPGTNTYRADALDRNNTTANPMVIYARTYPNTFRNTAEPLRGFVRTGDGTANKDGR